MSTNATQPEIYEMEVESFKVPRTLLFTITVSLAIHVVALGLLGLFKIAQKLEVFATISSVIDDPESEPIRQKFDTAVPDQVGIDGELHSFTDSREASRVLSRDPLAEFEKTLDRNLSVGVPITENLPQATKLNVLATVATTGGTEHAGGVDGAIDRLAFEIASSLREKKTLVVWLFDVSPSLSVRREKIADRVETVYKQLNDLNLGGDKALKSAVAVFGEKCTIVTDKPLDDSSELVKTVRKIKSESSGDENTFSAVMKTAKHFLPFRTEMHRDVMFIVVTDEEGTDLDQQLDDTITFCKRYGMRVYCVGDSAPFGRKDVEAPFVMENGDQVIGVMTKGPESKFPELLRLGFWGTQGYDLEDMSSGFGPYGLTRLCAETNGLYFITDNGRGHHRFDPAVMRNYSPDYRPVNVLTNDIRHNKAKLALTEACNAVELEARNRKVLSIPMPRLDFRAENDTVLRQEITEAQKPVADLNLSLENVMKLMEIGEKDRPKIKEARWQASYDLAMGRTLALNVRGISYNKMLAEMKANPKKFDKAGNNQWRLVPSKDINSGIAEKKMASKAAEYLNRVIDEHPGTPWALIAEREKSAPMGWEWKESHYDPVAAMGGGNQKQGPKFIDVEDPKTKKKVKKQINAEPQHRNI